MKIIFLASSYKMYVQLKNWMKGFVIFFILKIINGKVWWFYLYAPVHTGAAPVPAPVCTRFFCIAPVNWCGAERCQCKNTGAHHISLLYTGVLVWCKKILVQAHRCMVDFLCCTGPCTGAFKNFSFRSSLAIALADHVLATKMTIFSFPSVAMSMTDEAPCNANNSN